MINLIPWDKLFSTSRSLFKLNKKGQLLVSCHYFKIGPSHMFLGSTMFFRKAQEKNSQLNVNISVNYSKM